MIGERRHNEKEHRKRFKDKRMKKRGLMVMQKEKRCYLPVVMQLKVLTDTSTLITHTSCYLLFPVL